MKAAALLFGPFDLMTEYVRPGGIWLSWFTRVWGAANAALDANDIALLVGADWGDSLPINWARSLIRYVVRLVVGGVYPVPVAGETNPGELEAAVREHGGNWDVHLTAGQMECRDDDVSGNQVDLISPHSTVKELFEASVPIYMHSGWLDGANAHAAIRRFGTLARMAEATGSTAQQRGYKLTLGPWQHAGAFGLRRRGAAEPTCFDHRQEAVRFLDAHLQPAAVARQTGMSDEEPVHYFTVGGDGNHGQWHAANEFPPRAEDRPTSTQSWKLRHGGSLTVSDADGADAHNRQLHVQPTVFYHANTGSGGAARWNTLVNAFNPVLHPHEQRVATAAAGAAFRSAPLRSALEVTGFPVVVLHMRFSCAHAAVFVYLEDVHADDGHVGYVTEGQLRAAFHEEEDPKSRRYWDVPTVPYRSFNRRAADPQVGVAQVPAEIGAAVFRRNDEPAHNASAVVTLRLHLLPVSYVFDAGHRIQVTVAPADTDHFEDKCAEASLGGETAQYELYTDSGQSNDMYESWADLPVIRH